MLSIFIGLPWVVFSGIAKVKTAGSRSSGKGGSGIRKSELEALIAVSVEEATAPLLRRVEVLVPRQEVLRPAGFAPKKL